MKSTLNILVRTDAESPMLWPPDAKNWLTGKKTPDAGEDWRQEGKGMAEEFEFGHEFEFEFGHDFE